MINSFIEVPVVRLLWWSDSDVVGLGGGDGANSGDGSSSKKS